MVSRERQGLPKVLKLALNLQSSCLNFPSIWNCNQACASRPSPSFILPRCCRMIPTKRNSHHLNSCRNCYWVLSGHPSVPTYTSYQLNAVLSHPRLFLEGARELNEDPIYAALEK